ncbi:MAG: hypothetical protein UR85_C0007G0007 [Candidatus Nomurabacteria bacterium GW2011_GWF2_35_66]|uniref:Uncharacterized protein n=1 Tax=Candidatus Nomurabacteria bacterium GW2011_GWE1_35_16 TaxID=1618761 RepID=A0A0G0BAF8_9BACT|nr:MAG: hypothetical protein UR55_C0009G0051 [Candidatus Nomurabacteria bacterium GW2011_GWF1_34_20]KKP63009.1 MAG: hypothetical protein UR57_C0009G0052 [Candidatus Nomurabacteria bacterium GW2011_GWE2_34_25]KKP66413.1 MAG: hypothetical protein UR64_C0008G0051 [Candidatus Nomurabacteria bacterium GW2011_GWE1_35_16]KKP83147.1 MAG: hypothetical protein UR85_C0007G0007 [Candidatus Nomurabacteria bacterium GW2011_GWF2_35_66]HAE36498.1 hypothetical protein [Candidatus Nomurabacteria bacterium]
MLEFFGYLSGILMMLSVIPYARSILRGETKPQRMTWLIWTILILIAFFSQLAKGATWSLLLTAGDAIAILITFILSIKFGVGGFRKIDIISLFGAGFSLLLWYLTSEPAVALFLIILIDLIGVNLTVVKTWKNPETENWVAWAICGVGGLFGILSVGSFNLILLSYPLYICLANSTIALIVISRKKYLHLVNKV